MRTAVLALVVAGLTLGGAADAAQSRSARDGELRLTRMLAGRVAGAPVSCIDTTNNTYDMIVVDEVGVVYDTGVTEPDKLRWTDRIEFVRTNGQRLCTSDKVWTFDRNTGLSTGSVQLGDFVPYTRG